MIEAHIQQRFSSEHPHSIALRMKLTKACTELVERGLADPKFVSELVSGQDQKFWACVSEALVADRLRAKSFPTRTAQGQGPDFLVLDGTRKVWIEVVCPEPVHVPGSWLNAQPGVVIDFPQVEILLRWTSAIKAKAEKLIGSADGRVKGYLESGIVAPEDAYVIAVNGCLLRCGPFSALCGISQFPFAAEAVFPIGPYQLKIDRDSSKVVDTGHQHRPYVLNKNGAQVPAYTFLDPRFSPISAIWAVDLNGGSAFGNHEPMAVVHNPNALNPVSIGFLPTDSEYVAMPEGDEFLLEKIAKSDASDG